MNIAVGVIHSAALMGSLAVPEAPQRHFGAPPHHLSFLAASHPLEVSTWLSLQQANLELLEAWLPPSRREDRAPRHLRADPELARHHSFHILFTEASH